ncbi:MAG: ATP-dependent Clp protease proteolytic subunit, partial [Bacteroidota bacterium]
MFPKDLRNKLAELRITSLTGVINLENIEAVREDLLRFALSSNQPIKLLIDSSGGFLAEGLFLFDFIKTI